MSEAKSAAPARRRELDFLRGLALIVMVTGHPVRVEVLGPDLDPIRYHYNIYGELFSAFFMFMSAINVTNFLASAKRTPNLDASRFYVRSSLALFAMGTSYNICVGTGTMIDIVQAIALGTLFTYFLLKWRLSTWTIALITIAIFAFGLYKIGPGPIGPKGSPAEYWRAVWDTYIVGPYTIDKSIYPRLGRLRYWMQEFGPIPWLAFFSYGVLIDRIPRGKWELLAIPFFTGVFVLGHFLPMSNGVKGDVVLLKVNPRYIMMTCGLMPAIFLAGRRWYRGAHKLGRLVESWGIESLVFLVFHWAVIMLLAPFAKLLERLISEGVSAWWTAGMTLLLMALLVPIIARKRDQWLKHPKFGRRAWAVFIGCWVVFVACLNLTIVTALNLKVLSAAFFRLLSILAAYGAAMSFCFLYPHVRASIRRSAMRKPPPPAEPTPTAAAAAG